MKKNVLFSPLFLYNLALITHDATMSVNPSIDGIGRTAIASVVLFWELIREILVSFAGVPKNGCEGD